MELFKDIEAFTHKYGRKVAEAIDKGIDVIKEKATK